MSTQSLLLLHDLVMDHTCAKRAMYSRGDSTTVSGRESRHVVGRDVKYAKMCNIKYLEIKAQLLLSFVQRNLQLVDTREQRDACCSVDKTVK